MRTNTRRVAGAALTTIALAFASRASQAEPLTVDHAVKIALERNSLIVTSQADVLDAKANVLGASSGVLPHVSAGVSRSGSFTDNQPFSGFRAIGGQLIVGTGSNDIESYSTTPSLSGSWNVLNFSSLSSYRSAQKNLQASHMRRTATRSDVILETRREFYEAVKSVHLARVAASSLRVSRDDERRVRALFEVGSVSKADLLKAQVRTAQSEFDSLSASQSVTVTRVTLASQLGIREDELGEVDTVLVAEPKVYEEAALIAEARKNRPDIRASEAEVAASHSSLTAAHFQRLPYVTLGGSVSYQPRFTQKTTTTSTDSVGIATTTQSGFSSKSDRVWSGQVAVNWDFFDGLSTDSRIAGAQARQIRAVETRDALLRNLQSQVHGVLLVYDEALERERVARRALESAAEGQNLTQQKYNVGSATILDLIDAGVQLERAESDLVSAIAQIRVAEATVEHVRGSIQ